MGVREALKHHYHDHRLESCSCGNDDHCQCYFNKIFLGLIFLLVGLLYLAKSFNILPFNLNFNVLNFWPVLIIIIGLFLINRQSKLSLFIGILSAAVFMMVIIFIISYVDSKYDYNFELNTPIVAHIQKVKTTVEGENTIKISNIRGNQLIVSPLTVEGQAKGNWFFEGSFPVKLFDENGQKLGEGVAKAEGEWTTEDFVNFKAQIDFIKASSSKGVLILEKDNPSGDPNNSEKMIIPVNFY